MHMSKISHDDLPHEARIVRLETITDHITHTLERLDLHTTNMAKHEDIGRLETKVDTNFKWIMGMMISLFILNGALPQVLKYLAA